jgi:enoyl-CoA hydratase/carnithine racemase
MPDERILIEHVGRVCRITLNRPEVLNAMTAGDLRRQMREFLRIWSDDEVGSELLSGSARECT